MARMDCDTSMASMITAVTQYACHSGWPSLPSTAVTQPPHHDRQMPQPVGWRGTTTGARSGSGTAATADHGACGRERRAPPVRHQHEHEQPGLWNPDSDNSPSPGTLNADAHRPQPNNDRPQIWRESRTRQHRGRSSPAPRIHRSVLPLCRGRYAAHVWSQQRR